MRKSSFSLVCIIFAFIGCQNNPQKNDAANSEVITQQIIKEEKDTAQNLPVKNDASVDSALLKKPVFVVALTSNALQLVNSESGSTTELSFGKPIDQMAEILNKSFQSKVASIGINSECGAGPLKMAVWKNGLTIIFKEQTSSKEWQFAGWYTRKASEDLKVLQTMAGIGVGSTREEMEAAYVIKINKTSLGYEFSTSSGLYGIFDGSDKKAKITDMWSGLTCIFR